MKWRFLIVLVAAGLSAGWSAVASTLGQVSSNQRDPQVYYRFGRINVDSPNALTPEQVMKIAGIKSNVFAPSSLIEQSAGLIKQWYLKRGYLRADVSVAADYQLISPRTKYGLVELIIKIKEGPVFRTRRLEFIGNDNTRDQIVRRRVVLNEGEPYTEELLEKSLRRINDLGRFHKVTRDDVKIEIDDREQIVDLRIHLREKGR